MDKSNEKNPTVSKMILDYKVKFLENSIDWNNSFAEQMKELGFMKTAMVSLERAISESKELNELLINYQLETKN